MRFVIQRVKNAKVSIDGTLHSRIEAGLLVFAGICESDDEAIADKMVKKLCAMRIFADENGKTNLSVNDIGGKLLIVSQFTLYADCKHGNRPSFSFAAGAQKADALYNHILAEAEKYVPGVQAGIFGADMKVELLNDGPFTIILDSDTL